MLNQKTRKILVQLGNINQTQIISYPVTVVKMGGSIQAFLDISKETGCNESEFEELGIYNINELSSVIDVIENPEISSKNGILTIKNQNYKTTYATTSIDLIESQVRGNPDLISRIRKNKKILSFKLESKDLNNINKMCSLRRNLSDLKIISKNNKIILSVTSIEKSSDSFNINIQGECEDDSEMTLLIDSVNKLPISDYSVDIFKSEKGSLVAVFSSLDIDTLDIILTSKA